MQGPGVHWSPDAHVERRAHVEVKVPMRGGGPRDVCRLGPVATGLEFGRECHHPRSSLPSYYGYSLHTSKSVTGIDLRGVGG